MALVWGTQSLETIDPPGSLVVTASPVSLVWIQVSTLALQPEVLDLPLSQLWLVALQ